MEIPKTDNSGDLPDPVLSEHLFCGSIQMMTAFIGLSLAFALACFGLWAMMEVLVMLVRTHYPDGAVFGDFQNLCFRRYSWLPYFSIPAFGYAVFVSARRQASVERFCLFASLLAFAFVLLLFIVVLVGMSCGIPLFD